MKWWKSDLSYFYSLLPVIWMRTSARAKEAAKGHRQKWPWKQPNEKLKPRAEMWRACWLWGGVHSWSSNCLPAKHYRTIIPKRLMEAVQEVLTARTAQPPVLLQTHPLVIPEGPRGMSGILPAPRGHPFPTAERSVLFKQANMIGTIQNSKLIYAVDSNSAEIQHPRFHFRSHSTWL